VNYFGLFACYSQISASINNRKTIVTEVPQLSLLEFSPLVFSSGKKGLFTRLLYFHLILILIELFDKNTQVKTKMMIIKASMVKSTNIPLH